LAKDSYNGPAPVGNTAPIIVLIIQTTTATAIDFSQPILYNHFNTNTHTMPAIAAAMIPDPIRM
jgi:hypothetical protein